MALALGALVGGVIRGAKKLATKDGRAQVKATIQKGAKLVQKGRQWLNKNRNLTDAVAEGGPQIVDTPMGPLMTNESGAKTTRALPFILGGGLLLLLLAKK
jgi:hypothetical protein